MNPLLLAELDWLRRRHDAALADLKRLDQIASELPDKGLEERVTGKYTLDRQITGTERQLDRIAALAEWITTEAET